MKGMKEGKADGRKERQKEIGPKLFPRLHVADTKRVGPRAPHRNKMAIYEQFTIPSHRFMSSPVPLPSSGRTAMVLSASPIYQPQKVQVQVQGQAGTFDGRYPYGPLSYMNPINPAMAYMPTLNVGQYGHVGQASVKGSSGSSTVVDGAAELQQVPLVGESLVQTPRPSSHSKQSMPSKKGKDEDDFTVPIYSSATQGRSHRRPTLSAASGGHRSSQKDREFGKDKRIHAEGATVSHQRNNKDRAVDDTSMEQNDDMCCPAGSSECVTASINDRNGRSQEFSHGDHVTEQSEHAMNQMEMHMSQIEQDKLHRANVCQSNGDVQQDSQPSLAGHPIEGDKLREKLEHNDHSSESSENKSVEISEHFQGRRGISDETESSMLDNLPLVVISSRDVMDAIGQQDFWKAREDILRQQKMFSVQVFELHRILEVQKQIAISPNLLVDDEEVEEEQEEDAEVPLPPSSPPLIAEVPGETNVSKPSNIARPTVVEPPYPVHLPSQQGFLPVHPWQASPYGVNPWTARMGSPYMYVPYPSPYPPAGYGVYPLMGFDVAMYERSGGLPATTFPVWQPSGISQSWGARDPAAAAAWYGATQGPVMGPTETRVVEAARGHARVDSSGATSHVQRATIADDTGRQGGDCHTVAERTQKVSAMESFGWAKGWGRTAGRWERRDRGMLGSRKRGMRPEACNVEGIGSADERGKQAMDCGDMRGEGAAECGEHAGESPEGELGQGLLGGTRRGGALQERTVNRPHVAADPLPLFPVR